MNLVIYWFRTDLRLYDNPALLRACQNADCLLPVFIHSTDGQTTPWGFERKGLHQRRFLDASLTDLAQQLDTLGSKLYCYEGNPVDILSDLTNQLGATTVYCEAIEAPYEIKVVKSLQSLGIDVQTSWQSSMLDLDHLSFDPKNMPDFFTAFRKAVEGSGHRFTAPIGAIKTLPPLPKVDMDGIFAYSSKDSDQPILFAGGEAAALNHLHQYLARRLPDSYKKTRNELSRFDSSSKFSPWLALGCISARRIAQEIHFYEEKFGANDGTYWLWFEILWRDYFRFIAIKYGVKLFHENGLGTKPAFCFEQKSFTQWVSGSTGEALIDAGMHELARTGFLSNRMRQIVASYWIYTMRGNWQAGAAWFESQLIDYDVYSNQGNWLYIAGHGTDPRGGRAFNVSKQAQEYDADGEYRRRWAGPISASFSLRNLPKRKDSTYFRMSTHYE